MAELGTTLMEFGNFLLWIGVWYVVFSVATAAIEALAVWWLRGKMQQELTDVSTALDEERLIALTIEVDQNQYFCYNSITKDFVCQGRDLTEIKERFKLRYPDKDAAIYDGDTTAVETLRQQLKELKAKNENSISV
jgi:hypothetical protein